MFYWMRRSSGGPEALGGLDSISKAEILRGIVTEKLTTAAQEILAVVERTVAGYEEEAAGFRQELARQRRQLEVLLQPRVKLERRALIPDLDSHDVVVVSEGEEEEEQHTQTDVRPDVEDTGSLGLLWYDDDDEGEDEEQLPKEPATSCRQKREDLKDPDYQIPSRLFSPRVRSDRRKPGRPRISDTQSHLDLRIRILEDSQSDVLSKSVFQKYPVQELQCPRGLQEADFLDLLRSTFPQLAAEKPFDVFTSDRSRKLQPLKVKTLTPEEIYRSIRSSGAGNSALYIRLKTGEDPQTSSDDHQPLRRPDDDSPSSSASMTPDQSDTYTSLSSPRGQSERRRRGRPRLGEEPTHHYLRICMLEDSQSDVLSKNVFMKSSVQDLRCPRGLQEADFLDLLRSTFPQLDGDKRFDVFKSDRSRRLQRLRVKTLTPEGIYRSMKSTGVSKTLLYIRLKTGEEEEDEELNLLPRSNDATDDSLSTAPAVIKSDDARLSSSSSVKHTDGNRSTSQQQNMETDDDDAAESDVASTDDDWKPDPDLQLPKTRRRGRRTSAVERSKTPCKVCGVWYRVLGSLIKHAWSHLDEPQCVCGVCGEHFQSSRC